MRNIKKTNVDVNSDTTPLTCNIYSPNFESVLAKTVSTLGEQGFSKIALILNNNVFTKTDDNYFKNTFNQVQNQPKASKNLLQLILFTFSKRIKEESQKRRIIEDFITTDTKVYERHC